MQFSILMGSDQIARLAGWKEYEQILEYPVYVYPRRGEPAEGFEGRITPLTNAPLQDFASTDVRDRIGRAGRRRHARRGRRRLHPPQGAVESRDAHRSPRGAGSPPSPETRRSLVRARKTPLPDGRVGPALNDFNAALRIDDTHVEAKEFARMVQEILEFRYKDIYNP